MEKERDLRSKSPEFVNPILQGDLKLWHHTHICIICRREMKCDRQDRPDLHEPVVEDVCEHCTPDCIMQLTTNRKENTDEIQI